MIEQQIERSCDCPFYFIVFIDFNMPVLNGIEVTTHVLCLFSKDGEDFKKENDQQATP
jgi:CheY-like chemotaxis protein